jgi:hypothetical protein
MALFNYQLEAIEKIKNQMLLSKSVFTKTEIGIGKFSPDEIIKYAVNYPDNCWIVTGKGKCQSFKDYLNSLHPPTYQPTTPRYFKWLQNLFK